MVGGNRVQDGEAKYAGAFYVNNTRLCTVGIIGDHYVLTAAHCVITRENEFRGGHMKIVVGMNNLTVPDNGVVANVQKIFIPAGYNVTHWKTRFPPHDIAVLKVNN